MADLTDKQAAQTVKVVGADSSGVEGNFVNVKTDGSQVVNTGVVSTANSSVATLGVGAAFTGTYEEVKDFASLNITVISNVASATNGFKLQWSTDGTNLDNEDALTVQAGVGRTLSVSVRSRYFRIVYTNGGTIQATFRLQTVMNSFGPGIVTRPLTESLLDTTLGQVTKSLLIGRQGANSYIPVQVDIDGKLAINSTTVSSLPAASFKNQASINAGATVYTSFTAAQNLAIKQFYAGGTGIGKQVLYSYLPLSTQLLAGGDFETAPDVALWPYFTFGGGGSGTATLSTAQFFTGTHSIAIAFPDSAANNSNGIKQTFSTPLNISGWRYITARFYNTVSAGGAYTRTIRIFITDSAGSTRSYDQSGLSTASPFNTAGWIKLTGEIANPTSSTGTSFDPTAIVSIELRFVDSANKTGTVYWDTAQLESAITAIFPIYHQANSSFNVGIDPVIVVNLGDQILIAQTNNDSARKEFFADAGGVSI